MTKRAVYSYPVPVLAESTTWVVLTRRDSLARATIADVAREAGVNKGTVSRALRGFPGVGASTRERIMEAAHRLDFSASPMATALATGQSKTIGIVLPTLRSWYFAEVASAASEILIPAGFRVELINLDVDSDSLDVQSRAFRQLFLQLGPGRGRDGLLFAGTISTAQDAEHAGLGRVPAVLAGMPLSSVPGIFVDNRRGGWLVGEHLLSLGHRNVAVLDGRVADKRDTMVWQERTEGLRDALRESGVPFDDDQIVRPGGCEAEDGASALQSLLDDSRPLPTAIFCHCDQMAFGALATLRQNGFRVPQDISVAAFDDHPMSKFWGLTTVSQHTHDQGVRAAEALITAMTPPEEGAPVRRLEDLQVALRVRETTAPPHS